MKILLLAPQPFYQERGTPIAVRLLAQTLAERGDSIDLLTYHEGADLPIAGVRHHRIPNPLGIRGVGPGPSLKKILCDVFFFGATLRLLMQNRYDMVHAVEESVFMAGIAQWFFRVPFVYDMDSSMAQQLVEKYPQLGPVGKMFGMAEGWASRKAAAVIPVCDALADIAQKHGARRIVLLKDISLLQAGLSANGAKAETLNFPRPRVMYIGNFESYQGVDLLLESFAIALKQAPGASLVLIGGTPAAIEAYQRKAEALGIAAHAFFLGPRPVGQMAHYMEQADVLASPRTKGNNTPMKVYSYLDSGKAVLATDLPTHRQALTSEIAELAAPNAPDFSAALVKLLKDASLRERLGRAGKLQVDKHHSLAAFRNTVHALYQELDLKKKSARRN